MQVRFQLNCPHVSCVCVKFKNLLEESQYTYDPQRWCMKRGWVFEARLCPTTPNVFWKTKLQIYTEPQAGINTLCVPSMAQLVSSREISLIIQRVQVPYAHSIDAH